MTTKEQNKKITIDDILKKKKLVQEKNVFYSTYFKKEIDIEKIPYEKILEIMAAETDDEISKYIELIYLSCPFFRSKEVHEALDVKIPTDVIAACYGDNICEILELGNLILSKYGFTEEKLEKVKKQ